MDLYSTVKGLVKVENNRRADLHFLIDFILATGEFQNAYVPAARKDLPVDAEAKWIAYYMSRTYGYTLYK